MTTQLGKLSVYVFPCLSALPVCLHVCMPNLNRLTHAENGLMAGWLGGVGELDRSYHAIAVTITITITMRKGW